MKKLFFAMCAMLISIGTLTATEYNNVLIDGIYYYLNDNYNYSGTRIQFARVVSNPNKYAGNIDIPASVEYNSTTFAVKAIGDNAFQDCSNLTRVVLPEGITSIGGYAFRNCGSLLSINIPNSVTSIGYQAFQYCSSLTSIQLPNSITGIQGYTFYECSNLRSIELPNHLQSIGNRAFQYCSRLDSISLPSSVTSIGEYAFYGCDALKYVNITDLSAWCNISFVNEYSTPFSYAHHFLLNGEEITELVIPSNITSIKQYAFHGCSYITSVGIPDNVQSVEVYAFLSCSSLASVTLGANIANLNKDAFNGCTGLKSVNWNITNFIDFAAYTLSPFYNFRDQITSFTFGENVQHIPAFMCYQMSNLRRIDIPASVTNVGEGAFAYCGRLTEINAAAGSPLYSSEDGVLFNKTKTSLIIYPAGKTATSYTVPSTVQTIEENAFYGCTNLSAITIPASVTSIGAGNATIPMWSFTGSVPPTITENAFPSDVNIIVDAVDTYKTAWPEYASHIFPRQYAEQTLNLTAQPDKSSLHVAVGEENLANVIKLTISGTINSYDLMIMRNKMINLRELDLTEASIEANAYEYYTGICSHADTLLAHSFRGLRSIKLPRTLKYAEQAMIDCPDLKYAEFNAGVVGNNIAPYKGNGDLQVVLNEGVTEIKPYAFAVSGASHDYYNNNAAQVNTKLRSVTLPNSLSKVAEKRFWYCRNLIEVTLGDALTKIDDYAFCECHALTSIILPTNLDTIGNFAFQGTGLTKVTIPQNVKYFGNGAFLSIIQNRYYSTMRGSLATDLRIGDPGSGYLRIYISNELYAFFIYSGITNSSYSTTGSLKSITFSPNSQLKEIGIAAFAFSQLKEIAIPDNVSIIGTYAFAGNEQLKSIVFGENSKLRTIKRGVFQNTTALEHLVLPGKLVTIGELAFSSHEESDALAEVIFPTQLQTINRSAFYGRKGLHRISFPTSLQTIGDYAFYGCTSLDEIRVPSSLLSVGDHAFDNCSNVTKVYTYTVEPVSIDQNTFSCWRNADLYVPTTSYYTYYYNTQWSQFLSLQQFDEEYSYFYINNDYELGGGTGIIDGNPDADLNENSGLIVTGDQEQGMGVITVMGDGVNAGSIIACEENLKADSLIVRIVTKKGQWNYFCFPFDILLEQLHFAHQYAIREYSGATRALYGAGGWVDMVGDMIYSGLGYIFQGAQTDTLEIVVPNPRISCQDYEQVVHAFNADDAIDENWNFIGNPYPSWYDLDELFYGGFSSPIYVWDAGLADYKVYRPGDDDYHFHPYEGFFTQNPDGQDMTILWGSDGRETKKQADNKRNGNHAPRQHARRVRQQHEARQLIDISLASADYADRARVVFNSKASLGYELGRDAVMMDGGQAPLHIWSIAADNNRLAINERPYVTGEVALGYDVNEAGYYTLSAPRMDKEVIIYDNELNQEVDLSMGDYIFYTDAGTNETRFAIVRIKQQEEVATAITDANDEDEFVNVYTLLGVKLLNNVRRGDISLGMGVYVIEHANGTRSELTIK